ncbi:glycoside hydrolase family 2 TIM barrel-domain containing protein [Porticoccaceae bacterium LTM1]|nr:glycoside hydrolase family 2 TIM barrel-domain containing protein [Porticoccaceae bacterium LTM1]
MTYSQQKKLAIALCLIGLLFCQHLAAREVIDFNRDWSFSCIDLYGDEYNEEVNLPHSWNGAESWDADRGKVRSIVYRRGLGTYRKWHTIPEGYRGKRLFLRFEAANFVADLNVNGKHVGQHRGGYSAFVFEVTDYVVFGAENQFEVQVDNSANPDIMPLQGDYNLYGGLVRPVQLLVTEQINITPLDFGGPGVYLQQKLVEDSKAEVELITKLDNGSATNRELTISAAVIDRFDRVVATGSKSTKLAAGLTGSVELPITIANPVLWQGRENPYLYLVVISLFEGSQLLDRITQPLGLRSIAVDPDKGLLLNGMPLKLNGVALHEDWPGVAVALTRQQRERDFQLIHEIGANAVRLAHYPHGNHSLELSDKLGIVAWSEIPFVGFPIGPVGGYSDSEEFRQVGRQQLIEMIRQRYNHPSVLFWGLYNELPNSHRAKYSDSRNDFVRELQRLAKQEDPDRYTVSAAFVESVKEPLNQITDLQFWNRYHGWYYGSVNSLGPWLDRTHKKLPERPIGISEYGAGASVNQHREGLDKPYAVGGAHHEENWQAYLHEHNWRDISVRDYLVGSFVWSMFDFTSTGRQEGDSAGLNNKGLVSYDRKVKKDAFYFYKANWSDELFVYITDRRNLNRSNKKIEVKVYSNLPEVELMVNGISLGSHHGEQGVFIWEKVELQSENNAVKAIARGPHHQREDGVIWNYDRKAVYTNMLGPIIAERYTVFWMGAFILWLLYLLAHKTKLHTLGHIAARTSLWGLGACYVLYLVLTVVLKYYGLLGLIN